MLDPKWVAESRDLVVRMLQERGQSLDALGSDPSLWDLDKTRRATLQQVEQRRGQQRKCGEEIAKRVRAGDDASGLKSEMKVVAGEIGVLEQELQRVETELRERLLLIPNTPDASVPAGHGPEQNVEVRRVGEPRAFDFWPKAHWDLGADLGILDFERAAKISGARFSVAWGMGAQLERALGSFMLDLHTRERGYTEVLPPYLVTRETLVGTGQLPKFEGDLFKTRAGERDLFLIPTAEVPLTTLHRDEMIEADSLPRRYVALTPSFRSEAGSYGKDVRGLIRQHQFHKVELVKLASAETSFAELETMVSDAEEVLKRLDLPYRVMLLCKGDMGFASAKTYDLEVWLPGQSAYREISSCSNCTDFQARRSGLRYRPDPRGKPRFLHTLNGSGLAVGRTLIAVLENYQQADGSILIPDVLRPYMGGADRITSRPL